MDRLTSGILILGKNSKAASKLSLQLREKTLVKEYLALVRGKFPTNNNDNNIIIGDTSKKGTTTENINEETSSNSFIRCTVPIFNTQFTDSPHKFISDLQKRGAIKFAITDFKRLSYNPSKNESLVKCIPQTGRTHQIRKHLAILGYPIVNDSIYQFPEFLQLSNIVIENIIKTNKNSDNDNDDNKKEQKEEESDEILNLDINNNNDVILLEKVHQLFSSISSKVTQIMISKQKPISENCPDCASPEFYDPIDPQKTLILYLHAHKYSAIDGSFSYQSNIIPKWAV